ncbi:nitrogen fixation protein [Marinobacter guineae]|uniref:Nitrogen fixation protein n=1 Tax=Marinobacter guineae TaxID=432303 RepID=A0A2G1VHQ1_9GAMM|nr:nitrogen fixation protein [Marinobacter guineae]
MISVERLIRRLELLQPALNPELKLSKHPNREDLMKIAVTSQNRKTVTQHAGRCRKFFIFHIVEGQVAKKELLELPKEQSFRESSSQLPHPLDDIDVLITRGMGSGLAMRLNEKGIESVITEDEDPEKAVRSYLTIS